MVLEIGAASSDGPRKDISRTISPWEWMQASLWACLGDGIFFVEDPKRSRRRLVCLIKFNIVADDI